MNKRTVFFMMVGYLLVSHSIMSQNINKQYLQQELILQFKAIKEICIANLVRNEIDTNNLRYIPIANSINASGNEEVFDTTICEKFVFSEVLFINNTSNKVIGSCCFCKEFEGCYLQISKRKYGSHTLACFTADRYTYLPKKLRKYIRKKKDCQLIIYDHKNHWLWIDSQNNERMIKKN